MLPLMLFFYCGIELNINWKIIYYWHIIIRRRWRGIKRKKEMKNTFSVLKTLNHTQVIVILFEWWDASSKLLYKTWQHEIKIEFIIANVEDNRNYWRWMLTISEWNIPWIRVCKIMINQQNYHHWLLSRTAYLVINQVVIRTL